MVVIVFVFFDWFFILVECCIFMLRLGWVNVNC